MVHFHNFHVPVRTKPRRGLAHQMRQQRDAKRGVAGLQDGNRARGLVDRGVMAILEPGRADHQRDAGPDRGMQIGIERLRGREIDQYVARIG